MSAALPRLVNALHGGLVFRSIYFADHPRVAAAACDVEAALTELRPEAPGRPLFLGVARRCLVFEGRPRLALTPLARRVIDLFDRMKCGGIHFHEGVTRDEIGSLFSISADLRDAIELETARKLLRERGITHLELSSPFGTRGWSGGDAIAEAENLAGALPEKEMSVYHQLMEVVDTSHVLAARGQATDTSRTRARAEELVNDELGRLPELMRLAQYPDFDAYTVSHSVRVALLGTLVADRLGLAKELMVELATAALLHDVGKSQIPAEILFKNGPLTDDERRVMGHHPRLGAEILLESREANPWSVCAAYGHHIRHDRRGYPAVPRWVRLSRATALVQVCDVFEALTAVRPYKPPLTPQEAYSIILRDRHAFDPAALKAFTRAVGLFPPGSRVVLSDGSEGVVVRAGERIDRPSVQLRQAADGSALDLASAPTLDLAEPKNAALSVKELVREPTVDVEADPAGYEGRATTILLRNTSTDPCERPT